MKLPSAFVLLALFLFQAQGGSIPGIDEILKNLSEHSRDRDLIARRNTFAYQRTSRIDYLDDQGNLKHQAVRLYQITPVNGKPVTHLLSINGHSPTQQEEYNRSPARETGDKSRSLKFSPELLSHFQFVSKGADSFMNRPVWVLDFSPKPDAEGTGFLDRLVSAMSGTIWIDQEEFQMAKITIHLSKKVSFFGGLAGAIEHLDMNILQKRMEPGVFMPEALTLDFAGRKLFSPVRFRCFENCSDFHKTPTAHASAVD